MDNERDPQAQPTSALATTASKKRLIPRPLIAISAAIIVIALAIGAFFLMSIAEDNAIKTCIARTMEDDADGTLSGTIIPSRWGDQSGFSFKRMQLLSFERDPLASPQAASATIRVTADNDYYGLLDDFAIACEKIDGAWTVTSTERTVERYEPISAIPDEVLSANLPAIIEAADASNAETFRTQAHMLANVFGADTTASIDENEMADGSDYVTMTLATNKDGRACTGCLDMAFDWVEQPNGSFDWDLGYIACDDETAAMAGSFPHEGMSYFDTDEQASEAEDLRPAAGQYYMMYLEEILVRPETTYAMLCFENIPHNDVDMEAVVVRSDTNETLCETPRIAPNMTFDTFEVPSDLAPGEYPITLRINAYEKGTSWLAGTKTLTDIMMRVER